MEGIESVAKTLAAEDEDILMELQYFRDHNHCKEVYAKMMKDKSIESLGIEFFGLITKRKEPYYRWVQPPQVVVNLSISIPFKTVGAKAKYLKKIYK